MIMKIKSLEESRVSETTGEAGDSVTPRQFMLPSKNLSSGALGA